MLNYYRRAENNVDGASQYHGIGGPMPVTEVPYENPLSVAFMRAAGELGYRRNNDFNDWSAPQDGFGQFKVTQSNGERCSTANAYLPNGRANLDLKLGAHVTKVRVCGARSVALQSPRPLNPSLLPSRVYPMLALFMCARAYAYRFASRATRVRYVHPASSTSRMTAPHRSHSSPLVAR